MCPLPLQFFFSSLVAVLLCLTEIGCVSSPLGRKQLILIPQSQMNTMGEQAFSEMKQRLRVAQNPEILSYVRCIINPMMRWIESDPDSPKTWEIVIFEQEEANAFALPGGKIGVHTGILRVARTDAQLAAVLGHEIAHVLARHGAERVSQQVGTEAGLAALGMITPDNPQRKKILGLLGLGVQFGILLPFSRAQESEADLLGLEWMARAGFDPQQSVQLWQNMKNLNVGQRPPEWLSTHPDPETRIAQLQAQMEKALVWYRQSSPDPACSRPLGF